MSTPLASKTSLLRRISSDLGISLQALGVLIGVIGVIVAIVGIVVTVKVTTPESSGAPLGSTPSSANQTESSSSSPTVSPTPTAPSSTPTPTDSASEAAPEAVTYLDDFASQCGIALGTGSYSINGTDYAHTVVQWPNETNDITIKRRGLRFKATAGIRDTETGQIRVQFELQGDKGQQLFKSRVLSFGESQKVDVPVDGVLRITLRVKALSTRYGYAGWGDARITSANTLEC
jgi:NPCBM/NEW2 domain